MGIKLNSILLLSVIISVSFFFVVYNIGIHRLERWNITFLRSTATSDLGLNRDFGLEQSQFEFKPTKSSYALRFWLLKSIKSRRKHWSERPIMNPWEYFQTNILASSSFPGNEIKSNINTLTRTRGRSENRGFSISR